MPDMDDPRVERAMMEMERDMEHLDENNPKHMAHMMRKMKDIMPPGAVPKELDVAIQRLEAGEDPEKIEVPLLQPARQMWPVHPRLRFFRFRPARRHAALLTHEHKHTVRRRPSLPCVA